jgi:hypothetical protein
MAGTRSRVSAVSIFAGVIANTEFRGRFSDADEMWTQTISSLHQALRAPGSDKSFVDQYLSADLQQT